MSVLIYDLFPDRAWNRWRLQKAGSQCAESLFLSKEMAMRLLPEATEGRCKVFIHDTDGEIEQSIDLDPANRLNGHP